MLDEALISELLAATRTAREAAYCPYSGYAVGAAVLDAGGGIHSGCNVENISYGLSVCAERHAVAAAVAAGLRPGELRAVALVAGPRPSSPAEKLPAQGSPTWPAQPTPCGACLQVLAEFAAPDCAVVCVAAAEGALPEVRRIRELLPRAFRPELG